MNKLIIKGIICEDSLNSLKEIIESKGIFIGNSLTLDKEEKFNFIEEYKGFNIYKNLSFNYYFGEAQELFKQGQKRVYIQDQFNENKVWLIVKDKNRNFYYTQFINNIQKQKLERTTKKFLNSLFENFSIKPYF